MTRAEVRNFIRDGVNLITPAIEFGSGDVPDFNSFRGHSYPSVWCNPISVSGSNPTSGAPQDEWKIELIIGKKDAQDSTPEDYEQLIDDCDEIAQKLTYNYNLIVSGYKLVTLTGREREPFIKKFADCISGVYLRFTINSPDQTNLC